MEEGLSVLSRFASDLQLPTATEEYDRLILLKPSDQPFPIYTREQILFLLRRIHDSPPISCSYQGSHTTSVRNSYSGGRPGYGRLSRGLTGSPHFVRGSRGRTSRFRRNPITGSVGVIRGQSTTAEPSAGSSGISDVSQSGQSPISQSSGITPTSDRRDSGAIDDLLTIT